MAFSLRQFLRHTPSRTIKSYCESRSLDLSDKIDWVADEKALAKTLFEVIEEFPIETRLQVAADFERAHEMSDEVGQTAMLATVPDRWETIEVFEGLQNAHERSLWLFVNDGASFQRAEEARYTDDHRKGRMWSGFLGPQGVTIDRAPDSLCPFEDRLQEYFRARDGSGRTVKIEIFDRMGRDAGGEAEHELVQITIYLEGIPSSVIEFEGADLARRVQRPAIEVALTYCATTGAIDVVAKGGRPVREELARMFAEALLHSKDQLQPIVLRPYDLFRLRRPFDFSTDPEDGIRSVKVTRLRLRPYGDDTGRITLEAKRNEGASLYDLSRAWFDGQDPLVNGFMIQHAKLSIEFYPKAGAKRGKILAVEITTPNGCNLKDRTERECLIGEKYLARWGLVQEILRRT